MALLMVALAQVHAQSADAPKVVITLLNQDPDPVEPGGTVDVRIKIENKGSGSLNNVFIELSPDYPLTLAPGEDESQAIGSLDARVQGASAIIQKWKLKVADDVQAGTYNLDVQYRVGTNIVKLTPLRIEVKSSGSILNIKNVVLNPQRVAPGEQATLSITIQNLADITLQQIKAKLDLSGLPFAPIGSTNEITLGNLIRGEETKLVFNLITLPNAESQVHKVPVTLSYFDNKGVEITRINSIGIVVDEKPDFTVSLEDSKVVVPGRKGDLILSVSNRGISPIKFVTLEIEGGEGYSVLSSQRIYLGNLESDDFETAQFTIFPEQSGDLKVPFAIEYKDSYNRPHREKIEIPVKVYTASEAKKYGLVAKQSYWPVIIVVFVAVLVLLWWRRKTKKKH